MEKIDENFVFTKNPLLKIVKYCLPDISIQFDMGIVERIHVILLICEKIRSSMPGCVDTYKDGMYPVLYMLPTQFLIENISVSLNDAYGFLKILKFGNSSIWELGCESGYNSKILANLGCDVYPTELRKKSECITRKYRFTKIFYPPYDQNLIQSIAKNEGALLMIWPNEEYYEHLSTWVFNGGKKVIVSVNYTKNPFYKKDGNIPYTICARFPPLLWKDKFKLVDVHIPPHYDENTPTLIDCYQFWILKE